MKPTFRASEMDRIFACNGSISLVPLVNPRQGDDGWEGSVLHYMIADRLIKELGAMPPEGGLKLPDVPKSYKLPSFSRWIVDWSVRHVRETIPDDWSLQVEVPLAYEYDNWNSSGHHDLLAMSPDGTQAKGKDWKTGYSYVDEAGNNWQVATYVALEKMAWPELIGSEFEICQPRADEDEGFERITRVLIEGSRLALLPTVLDGHVNAAMANCMELNTGLKQCSFCPAAIQCPAQIQLRETMKLTLTPEMLAAIETDPNDSLLGDWVMDGRTLSRPIEDAEKMLKERIRHNGSAIAANGTQITIKSMAGSYSFPDPVAFYRATREIIADDEKYAGTVKPSVTRTKDMIAEVLSLPKTSKKGQSAQSVFDGALRPLCEQGTRDMLVFTQ